MMMTNIPLTTTFSEPWYYKLHDLMPFRVREILLVSSSYDAFILEEDGQLTERLFVEFSELNLSSAPRMTHVATTEKAMQLMQQRRFDMVLALVRLGDTDVTQFAKKVKEIDSTMPMVVLVVNESDFQVLENSPDTHYIDQVFLWTSDANILLAAIKLIEDRLNAEHDINSAGVMAILVVEDSLRRYSSFLPMLYNQVMSQSQSLISEGLNDLHKMWRMRARPKIFLTNNYEQAVSTYNEFKDNIIGIISDVCFDKDGMCDQQAGFKLAEYIRKDTPDKSIVLLSASPENAEIAQQNKLFFLDKNSPSLHSNIRLFLKESLGFGEFVFRLPNREEVGRANDMYEMLELLKQLPVESLAYHSNRNDFSTWLRARSMFILADRLKPRTTTDFQDLESFRTFLIKILKQARHQEQQGIITDYSSRLSAAEDSFIRLGSGSIGGKGRGIAFVNSLVARYQLQKHFEAMQLRIPRSVAIGTNHFEAFMEQNNLFSLVNDFGSDDQIIKRFLLAKLPDELINQLRALLQNMNGPIAVRSSSLLEDAHFQPFAGIYQTYMLSNNHEELDIRLLELCRAIKAVYASTFSKNARSYIERTAHSIEDERMGIIIQQIVGKQYDQHFYPLLSGVAQTYNYYPIGHQTAEQGVAHIALGLGQTVVAGRSVLRFSPGSPKILPQFTEAADYLRYSQKTFLAVDLSQTQIKDWSNSESSLIEFGLEQSEKDNTFHHVGSVYSIDDDVIRENLRLPGPRIVSFRNILSWRSIPLAESLEKLLALLRNEFGCEVEIEFTVDYDQEEPVIYLLQVRPLSLRTLHDEVQIKQYPQEQILCKTDKSLGHGTFHNIHDIVWVTKQDLESNETPEVANHVGMINSQLEKSRSPYLLIGPGRWGSSDSRLGIPVQWSQLAGAQVIAETALKGQFVEPSQGTHFFQNMISLGIGYLTLMEPAGNSGIYNIHFDQDWLYQQPIQSEQGYVRHIHLDEAIHIHLNGKKGHAIILKSDKLPDEIPQAKSNI